MKSKKTFILTGDMPESCSECELKRFNMEEWICNPLNIAVDCSKLHPQCPLRPAEPLLEALKTIGREPMERAVNRIIRVNTLEEYNKLHKALGGNDE